MTQDEVVNLSAALIILKKPILLDRLVLTIESSRFFFRVRKHPTGVHVFLSRRAARALDSDLLKSIADCCVDVLLGRTVATMIRGRDEEYEAELAAEAAAEAEWKSLITPHPKQRGFTHRADGELL